ncbi:hypothetical protein [Caballeronia concitans]|nr:hypothetical protein [Caballeronia concitans]
MTQQGFDPIAALRIIVIGLCAVGPRDHARAAMQTRRRFLAAQAKS